MFKKVSLESLNLLLSMNVKKEFEQNCTKFFNCNSSECYVT